jgi:pimeloyl-ACP methyl ester carboxylesterase
MAIDHPATAGDERPVVLIHGFASSFEHGWRSVGWVDILADIGRPVIGIDLLGHGQADRPIDPAAYEAICDHAMAQLPANGTVDAVGFSVGAHVLLRLVIDHPDRFGRIAILGMGDNLLAEREARPLADALEAGTQVDDVRTTLFQRLAASAGNDPKVLAAFLRHGPPPVTESELAEIRSPVLIVLGDRDTTAPEASRLAAAIPHSTFRSVRGVDHFATPADFAAIDAVVEFLGSH